MFLSKGINTQNQCLLLHDIYKRVYLREMTSFSVKTCRIISKQNTLYTRRFTKRALLLLDRKRFWFGPNKSVAYAHPSIANSENEEGDNSISVRKRANDNDYRNVSELDLNRKKIRKCEHSFK